MGAVILLFVLFLCSFVVIGVVMVRRAEQVRLEYKNMINDARVIQLKIAINREESMLCQMRIDELKGILGNLR